MTLYFRLLVIDDEPMVLQAVQDLRRHLEEKGFSLTIRQPTNLSVRNWERLVPAEGQDLDLVMVDFNLGKEHNGADFLQWFRSRTKFTETVFYTAGQEERLRDEIKEKRIDGVFVATRENLDEVLTGTADIVIGKAMDLTHTRGLAMAAGADMEARMLRTIQSAVYGEGNSCVEGATERAGERLRKAKKDAVKGLKKKLRTKGFSGILDDRLFDARHRWMTILSLAKCLSEKPDDQLETVKRYGALLDKRNLLAHVEEGTKERRGSNLSVEGVVGDTAGGDKDAMAEFRRDLRRHGEALEAVCDAIDQEFGRRGKGKEPQS